MDYTYLGQYSLMVKTRLCKFLGNAYPLVDFRVVFQSAKRIENLFSFKDHIPTNIYSSVVYKFTCSSCQATYYGKTSRHFVVRCREHLRINKKGISIKVLLHPLGTILMKLVMPRLLMIFVFWTKPTTILIC